MNLRTKAVRDTSSISLTSWGAFQVHGLRPLGDHINSFVYRLLWLTLHMHQVLAAFCTLPAVKLSYRIDHTLEADAEDQLYLYNLRYICYSSGFMMHLSVTTVWIWWVSTCACKIIFCCDTYIEKNTDMKKSPKLSQLWSSSQTLLCGANPASG